MDVTLELRRWGRGPQPALFVHGFTGDASSFDHLEPLLGEHVSAAAVALPGHGGSPPLAVNGASWTATVAALASAIERAHRGPAHLIGYSMGARLALAVALARPDLVRSLVLESGTAGLRTEAERAQRGAADEELAAFVAASGVAAFVDRWEQSDVLAGLARLPAARKDALRARRLTQRADGLAWALRHLGVAAQPDLWPELGRLRARTLLVHGARDDKFRAAAERMALRIPDAAPREVRGAGHTPHLERPERYAALLVEFLAPVAREEPPPERAAAPTSTTATQGSPP